MTEIALRQRAHTLIDAISPQQLDAVVGLLTVIVPGTTSGQIPFEDEPISDLENAQAASASNGPWTPIEEVMAKLNITKADLDLQQLSDQAAVRL